MPTSSHTLTAFSNSSLGYGAFDLGGGSNTVLANGVTLVVDDDDPIFDDEQDAGGQTYDTSSQVLGNAIGNSVPGQVIQSVFRWAVTNQTTGETGFAYILRIYTGTDPADPGDQDGQYYQVFTIAVHAGDILVESNSTYIGQVPYASLFGADHAPVIDLNGADTGIDNTASYTENDGPVILAGGLAVTDSDDTNIESASVSVGAGFIANADYLTVNGGTNGTIGAITFAYSAATGILTLTGSDTLANYQAVLAQVGFESTSDDPGTSRTIVWTVNDGDQASTAAHTEIAVTPVDDAAVAQPDAFTTDEATAITGSVFSDNGSGPDSDPDSTLTVTAVNGSEAAVGVEITLASGALLTLNQSGKFGYNPNHAFDDLPAAGSGASNLTETDSFTYTLAGGAMATVTVTVNGVDSDDTLLGTSGSDTLIGGIGVDTMSAGAGDDNYYVDNAGDRVIELPDEGRDVVYASASWALEAGSSVDVISADDPAATSALALAGNELRQEIHGNAGDNLLLGRGGDDLLVGGLGDDTYYISSGQETLVENDNEGRDVVYTGVSFNLTADQSLDVLAALDPSATDAINLGGNELRQEIYGNAGDNILNGLGGDDLLAGGGGDDTYYISSGTETIVEGAGGGHDVVYTPMSYALAAGAQIEAISTTSIVDTTALNLAGNEFAQEIYGNNGNNILQGRGGADLLAGYGGDDTYYVVDGGERIVENVGGGSDTVYASVNYALTAGSEVEALSAVDPSATSALNLTGNELGQGLYGNAGANILNGLDGNDYLLGGAGADSFQFTTTLGLGNVDRIGDFISGTDKIVLDDAVFSGLGLGSLPASVFHVGASATDEDQRIVYDDATGNLYYDADGSGAGAQVLFATLDSHPVVTASDFSVI